ncbi:MAG: hypothetical protein REI78_15605 [Pedobacter sp.]|nr:hypothetical protein [Pedobacter sp.]MDQ8054457.1 hypothetical protein [Pedobacter sp.]
MKPVREMYVPARISTAIGFMNKRQWLFLHRPIWNSPDCSGKPFAQRKLEAKAGLSFIGATPNLANILVCSSQLPVPISSPCSHASVLQNS